MPGKEPKKLVRGREFHKKIQDDWLADGEGTICREKSIRKPGGRKGRIDVHAKSDESLVAVAEIKASDWNKMTSAALKRNVRRQIRQIRDYIESQLHDGKDVSPGVVFPERPRDPDRLALIENLFEAEGIAVVWDDETIEERRNRSTD